MKETKTFSCRNYKNTADLQMEPVMMASEKSVIQPPNVLKARELQKRQISHLGSSKEEL